MIKVGQLNNLRVIKEVAFGVYLDGGSWGEILLPNKFVPKDTQVNDKVDVFIYFDSEDKIIATTQRPRAQLGGFAYLKVIDVNPVGAFLDWGLDKDLLVPKPEQQRPMEQGKSYIVYLKLDNKGRIIASSKVDYYLDKAPPRFKNGDEVNLLIADATNMGCKVIINDSHWGLIHSAEIFKNVHYGQRMKGFIKNLREDGKIDVVLRKMGQDNIHDLAERIMGELREKNGFLALHDKSSPLEIQKVFGESKSSFKNAIGRLYKAGEITIETDGIRLRVKRKDS
jgi:uncharacterized protein